MACGRINCFNAGLAVDTFVREGIRARDVALIGSIVSRFNARDYRATVRISDSNDFANLCYGYGSRAFGLGESPSLFGNLFADDDLGQSFATKSKFV
jgi:hypothetical protein